MIKKPEFYTEEKVSDPKQLLRGSETFFVQARDPLKPAPKIMLVASIAWTLWNYRLELIKYLENAGYEVILLAADDSSRLKLERLTNARFFPLKHCNRSSLSPFQNFRLLIELFRHYRKVRPDVLLLFTIRPNTLGNLAAGWLGIPTISTIEGIGITDSSWRLQKLSSWLYKLSLKISGKVIFLNRDDQKEFIENRIVGPEKCVLIPGPGINTEHFQPVENQRRSEGMVFIFIARLIAEKGIREFVQAAKALKETGCPAEFRIVGTPDSGNPHSIGLQELKTWADEGYVQCYGFLDDVRPAIAAADVLVLPTYYREGVPRSILEAMAMEKVIITTDVNGCRDTVENGKNGFLIPPRNVDALIEHMKKAMELSPAQLKNMGLYSRQKVEREFSDLLILPGYLELVQQAYR
ncbi:MAG: glycosyltransferase family 4 protein [Saprospiraceae bacterium]